MCLALTLTISHAPRAVARFIIRSRERSPIIISKLQLCGHDSSCSPSQLRRANSYAERRINYRPTARIPRASLLTIPAGLLHLI